MGKSYSGDFTFNAAFDVNAGKPIDTRLVVDALTDLTNSISYPYVGLLVYVKGEGKYYAYKETSSNVFEWVELTTSGGSSVSSLDDVPDGSTRKLANYLPLSGGTMSGRITRAGGGRWIDGRANAVVFGSSNASGGWNTIWSQKTKDGAWTAGCLGSENILKFNYDTDANFNAGTNVQTYTISFPLASGTIALTSDIPSLSDYLPLSGGTITGNLTVNGSFNNNNINATDGNGMLAYKPSSWTAVSSSQWGVGATNCQGVIRTSNADLIHYKGGTNYTIYDSSHFSVDTAATANTVAKRDANGYLRCVYLNSSNSAEAISSYSGALAAFYSTDGWLRKTSLANFSNALPSATQSQKGVVKIYASGETLYINT